MHQRNKSITCLFILVYLFSMLIFPLKPAQAVDNIEYQWVDSETIKQDFRTYRLVGGQSFDSSCSSYAEFYSFIGEYDAQTRSRTDLDVLVSDPLSGYSMPFDPGAGKSRTEDNKIKILDPLGVAPSPINQERATKIDGSVNGQIKITTRDGSGNPVNKNLLVGSDGKGGELKVSLSSGCDNFATLLKLKTDDPLASVYQRSAILIDDIYTWNQLTPENGFIIGVTYRLKTNYPDDKNVDCVTGEDNGLKLSEACRISYSGMVDFKVVGDPGNYSIQIVGNSTEWEREATGRIFPTNASNRENGFNLEITERIDSPFDKALSNVMKMLAGFVETGLRVTMNWVNNLLQSTDEYVLGDGVEATWTKIRNISLTVLVMALIIIAFANVLQIDIEQYGINRMIPKIIVAVIMAYMSWVIVLFFFDFSNVLQAQARALMGGDTGPDILGTITISTPSSADILAKVGSLLVLLILIIGVWVCGIVLLFLLLLRIVMLSFLLAIAPLAMIANILPFSSSGYKNWWNEFFKWMFMGPAAMLIIALGTVIASGMGFGNGDNTFDESTVTQVAEAGKNSGLSMLTGLLVLGVSMYLAATLPMKWGGAAMKAWGGVGKKLWGGTGGRALNYSGKLAGGAARNLWARTGIPGTKKIVLDKLNQGRENAQSRAANRLAQTISGGRLGMDEQVLRRQQEDASIAEASKQMGVNASNDQMLVAAYGKKGINRYQKAAIEREMAARGSFEKLFAKPGDIDKLTGSFVGGADEREAKLAAGSYLASKQGSDVTLEKSVLDNQGELAMAAYYNSPTDAYAEGLKNRFMAGQKGKSGTQKRTQAWEFATDEDAKELVTASDVSQIMNSKDSDSKRQNNLKKFIESGKASSEVLAAYQRETTKSSTPKSESTSSGESSRAAQGGLNPSTSATPTKIPDSINVESYEKTDSGLWIPPKK